MPRCNHSIRDALLASSVLLVSGPAFAADVTPERLLNPDKEPQNWLMNHRTYDGQRFSPLARINRDNVKNLKLAYAVPLGGGAGSEYSVATPLAEDGFLYVTDSWGVLYKIDGTSGDVGRIVWRMDPKQDRQQRNRGAALWGNLVITGAGIAPRIVATNKETGRVVWETSFPDTPDVTFTSAALPIRDKIIIGAANGDQGVRDWIGALDAATGKLIWRKFTVPAPGEPGSETWKGNTNAWQTGGGAVWVTGTYDPDTNQTIWGTGNPVPMFDPFHRPGDNLYTNSAISWDPDTGKMNWYFQFTPGDMWDYDEAGTHIMIDGNVAGQARKLITHSARNGFLYTYERSNGQPLLAKPYMEANWTKGIDQKTGKVVWETNMTFGEPRLLISAAPLPIRDRIIVGASGGDNGLRDWIAALDAATGKVLWRKFTIPAPGEPGSETWKGAINAWQTGGAAVWVTGTYDPATDQTIWGTGNRCRCTTPPIGRATTSIPTARFPGTRKPER